MGETPARREPAADPARLARPDRPPGRFLGWAGMLPVGVALLLAAVSGVLLVALPGIARIVQLRKAARRAARPPTAEP